MLLFLGVRTRLVVASLVPAMVMALFVMGALGIGLDQMSLAALIIAFGMLVDNAILTTESIMVQMAGGRRPIEAAVASAREPWPMPCAARRWTCRTGRRGRSGEKIVLRTIRQAYRGAEFEDLVPWTWGGREPAAARGRGDRRGRVRGNGPVRAVRRRANDAGLGVPDRGPERDRDRHAGKRVRRGGGGAPPRGASR